MLQEMQADILFLDPTDLSPATAALVERGFDVEVLDWVDPYGPTVWVDARITTDIAEEGAADCLINAAPLSPRAETASAQILGD